MPASTHRFSRLDLGEGVTARLKAVLPEMAERTVAAVTVEVPSYTDAFSGPMGQTIENAVQMALGTFLSLATHAVDADPAPQLTPALDGAYELGRGEARNGRSIDALLAAYRVGARVAWQELSATALDGGVSGSTIARFAEMVFAFIDELSASSATGHADQLATTGRVRERYLERLAQALLAGEPVPTLEACAEQANWAIPRTLTAVLLPTGKVRGIGAQLGSATLQLNTDLPGLDDAESLSALLVPDMDGARRRELTTVLAGRRAWVGSARPWTEVHVSYDRARRCRSITRADSAEVIDADDHLIGLMLAADPESARDLRRKALAPLADLRPDTADRLAETLRSWLLHQGRRDAVAAELFVHAQTVRYRMTQLRDLYGEKLNDPDSVFELLVALSVPAE
jgi:hypothetical protein